MVGFRFFCRNYVLTLDGDPWMLAAATGGKDAEGNWVVNAVESMDWDVYPRPATPYRGNTVGLVIDPMAIHNYAMDDNDPAWSEEEINSRLEHIMVGAFDAIWAEKAGRGLTAFHTALSRLRSALKTGENSPRLILVEAGDYRIDAARFTIDVEEFDTALAKAPAASDEEGSSRFYEQAINLYNGEYLQNYYYDWLFPERRRITQAYLSSLRALADHHYAHRRYTRSIELLERALRVDSLQED